MLNRRLRKTLVCNKRYIVEISQGVLEIVLKTLVLIFNFLYGRGKISNLAFMCVVGSSLGLASLLLVKSIYDNSLLTDRLRTSLNPRSNVLGGGFDRQIMLTCLILTQLLYLMGASFVPYLHKQRRLSLGLYVIISIASFILGVVPITVLRQLNKVRREIIALRFSCDGVTESRANTLNVYKMYFINITIAIVDLSLRSLVSFVGFLYGKGQIASSLFIVLVLCSQSIVSGLVIKTLVYDRTKSASRLRVTLSQAEIDGSDSSPKVGEQVVRDLSSDSGIKGRVLFMFFSQLFHVVGACVIPVLNKSNRIGVIPYIVISVICFFIGGAPIMMLRRLNKAEDENILAELEEANSVYQVQVLDRNSERGEGVERD